MAEIITMPKMSDTMEQGVLVAWLLKEGDTVKAGDILAEVETDKAVMELEAYVDGTLLYIGAKENEEIPVGGLLAIIGEEGEDYKALLEQAQQKESQKAETTQESTATTDEKATDEKTPIEPVSPTSSEDKGRIKVSPLAKKIAQDQQYDLSSITGTGTGGRIIKRDLEGLTSSGTLSSKMASMPDPVSIPFEAKESYDEIAVSPMRQTIAKKLSDSKNTAPHFYLTMEVNMDEVVAARKAINQEAPTKISFNDIIVKAAAMAIRQHPAINTSWMGERIRHNQHIHIGIAVAIEDGLLVPVARFADMKSLSQLSSEIKELGAKARNRQLSSQDWEGATFTISNLGMFGIDSFTSIINPPGACILAVGAIKKIPTVKDNQVVPGYVVKLTLSCDHRLVDGAVGAAFLSTLKTLLEQPLRMLV